MRQKEINSLKARLAKLEAEEAKEQQQRELLESAYNTLLKNLDAAGVTFSTFIKAYYKEVRKVTARIEKEAAKQEAAAPKRKVTKKSAKKRGRRRKAKTVIKIPAGKYSNVPAEPERVFEVKEKGPRPKVLKAYAEEVGAEAFMQQCKID